jgi:hypothetical protein
MNPLETLTADSRHAPELCWYCPRHGWTREETWHNESPAERAKDEWQPGERRCRHHADLFRAGAIENELPF